MIFVIESYFKNRKAKVEAWEQARIDWAKASQYHYMSEYVKEHPRPGIPWDPIVRVGMIVLIVVAFIGLIALIVKNAPTGAEIDKNPGNPHGCRVLVNKGDKVAVKDGDFNGSRGEVVGQTDDCSVNLILTQSTYSIEKCKQRNSGSYCSDTKNDGEILTVDYSNNIIKL